MTIQRWTDERLDQLATDVQNNSRACQANAAAATEFRIAAELMLQTLNQHQTNFEAVVTAIQVMQTEIRGLQLENRRMLEELRGRNDERQ